MSRRVSNLPSRSMSRTNASHPERHAAFPGHHRVNRRLHEDLRLAAADAADLEQLAGLQRAVRVHEGNPRQHGICQYPGEQRTPAREDTRGDTHGSARTERATRGYRRRSKL